MSMHFFFVFLATPHGGAHGRLLAPCSCIFSGRERVLMIEPGLVIHKGRILPTLFSLTPDFPFFFSTFHLSIWSVQHASIFTNNGMVKYEFEVFPSLF